MDFNYNDRNIQATHQKRVEAMRPVRENGFMQSGV